MGSGIVSHSVCPGCYDRALRQMQAEVKEIDREEACAATA